MNPAGGESLESVVDFHVHFLTEQYLDSIDLYVADDATARHLQEMMLPRLAGDGSDLTSYLEQAGRLGIRQSVIFGLADTARGCSDINDQVAGAVSSAAGAVVGFAAVPLNEPAEIEMEMQRAEGDLALAGVKIYPSMSGLNFLADPVLHVLQLAAKKDLIVLTDCSFVCWDAPHFFGTGNKFYHLVDALGQLDSRPRVVAAHLGGGLAFCRDLYLQFYGESALDEIWFDISPFFSPSMIRAAVETVTEDRLLFGSDYPISSGDENIRSVREADLPAPARRKIFHDNAEELLRN